MYLDLHGGKKKQFLDIYKPPFQKQSLFCWLIGAKSTELAASALYFIACMHVRLCVLHAKIWVKIDFIPFQYFIVAGLQ